MSTAAMLLAAALMIAKRPSRARIRRGSAPSRPAAKPVESDALAVASTLDVFAACLTSGMAVSAAAAAAAPSAPSHLAKVLSRAADLLALGADPAAAWAAASNVSLDAHGEALLRLARRSAASGSALAHGVADLADQSRHDAASAADAKAQRASVLIAGPLGLCYLPAFICLGIVPIVAGLAGDVLRSGLA